MSSGMIVSFAYSWKMTFIVLVWSPFVLGASYYESKLQQGFQDKTVQANKDCGQVASEAIKEIRTVAALGKQSYFGDRYAKAMERPHRLAKRKAYLSSISFAVMQSIALYAGGVSFYTGTNFIGQGMEFQALFICLMCVLITLQSAGQASTFVSTVMRAKVSAITTFGVLERKTAIDPDLEGYEIESTRISGNVSFGNIAFRYPARPDLLVFKGGFNLHGHSGQTIALVGPSGCGKSTCIGMLQRWYDPLSGAVRLDNQNVKGSSLHNLRSHMALVGQEPVLFDVTIGEYIRFGLQESKEVTQQELEQVYRAANIHNFIASLHDGYNTRVGAKGSQLPGGQKQRIAIARALIRLPRILLLDEATSALDSESEKFVQQAWITLSAEEAEQRSQLRIDCRLSKMQTSLWLSRAAGLLRKDHTLNYCVYADLVREQFLNAA